MTQLRRWGLLREDPDYLQVANQVQQIELYRQAAGALGIALPDTAMRSATLMDGKHWDGSDPATYARSSRCMPWRALPWLRFEKDSGMLRILLIDDTPRKIGRLKSALIEAGFEVIDESGLTIDLPERVEAIRPDVVLIDTDSPGRDVLEQVVLVSRDQPRPIVMFTDDSDPDAMRQAIRAGVSAYIVEGIQAQRLADPRRGNGPLRK